MSKLEKEDKALFIATGAYGLSVAIAMGMTTYPVLLLPFTVLFFWTGWRVKLLWLYVKEAKMSRPTPTNKPKGK